MRRLLAVLLLLAAAIATLPAKAADTPSMTAVTALPPGELPVRVRVALRVLNILRIAEVAGQGRLSIEVTQRWTDSRLRFDPIARGFARADYVGPDADAYLKTIWTPQLAVDNQTGDKTSRTMAVSVHSDGDVTLIERYESDFRFAMNLAAFPFDRQNLTLSMSLPRYAKQEAILLATEEDRKLSDVENTLSVADWKAERPRFANEEAVGWNARFYSRLNATVQVLRHSEQYILRIFVPILAVLTVSIFILWTPELTGKEKGTQIFSSMLALAALSFTFEASFPGAISLNTPVAQIISLGYFYLIVVLLSDVVLSRLIAAERGHVAAWLALQRHLRWALPAIMAIVCIGATMRALPA
ncbi:neurotransmitter-gated ion-channel ligand-binding protein [Undibacter mobilis]|uniref:Neurotransmitter-gated ion-channel ligand-binding protein n=1 Tax=Undibacter mobilis TaxID=2292256 RepID=A0A371B2Q2_9BRAD|nr:neurotransmitter-gated ion-channel ligand-binding protein [Undibacter mobilis]